VAGAVSGKFDPTLVTELGLRAMRRDRMYDAVVALIETGAGVLSLLDGWDAFATTLLFTLGALALALTVVRHRRICAVEVLRDALRGCGCTDCEEG
jgi:hypothetical protein